MNETFFLAILIAITNKTLTWQECIVLARDNLQQARDMANGMTPPPPDPE